MSGDFNMSNIDWDLMCATSTCQHADLLLDIAYAFDLHQVVHTATGQTAVSSSILHPVFIFENVSQLGYTVDIVPGISDHFSVLFKSQLWREAERSKPKPYYDFNNADDVSILDFLEQDYDFFLQCHRNFTTVNSLWLHFKCAVRHCMNKYIPKRHKSKRRSPWITREIIHIKRRVKRLSSKNPTDSGTLAERRSDLRSKIKSSRFTFFNVKMHNFLFSDPRKFWPHLTQKKEPVNKLKIHDKDVTDPTCIATAYNDYFRPFSAQCR